jgi:hypothetical protein
VSAPEMAMSARNATLSDLVALLRSQHAAKLDVVAPARDLRATGGRLLVRGAGEPALSMSGVTRRDALLRPTGLADTGIADKLGIPIAYLRRLRAENLGLYDANVNAWLAHQPDRRFLVRGLTDGSAECGEDGNGGDGGASGGVVRALLSDSFRIVYNLDVLMAVLAGIRDAGAAVDITGADLTESRMYVKVRSTEIAAQAPLLLGRYTSPFTGARGADNPLVFAGFVISNSETGHGKFTITPRLEVEVCANGLTLNKHALSAVHLGGKLPDGVIAWKADTQTAALDLVVKQARDAVTAFLDRDFVARRLAEIERNAAVEVTNPAATLEHVGAALRFPAEVAATILNHFIRGGDPTSGGVLHAVTSTAQTLPDADVAYDLERHGLAAMSLAAVHAAQLTRTGG